MQSKPIVFVVDGDSATRGAIRRLATLMDLRCQVFTSGRVFLETFDREECGCVLTELKVSDINGLQLQQRLVAEGVGLPVLFLTAHGTLAIAVRAMRAGAFHFLEKPFREQELWDALQEAVAVDQQRRCHLRRQEETRRQVGRLTAKEVQVLRRLAEGKTNRAIADELRLSIRAIEVRRSTLMKKLQFKDPEELVRFAITAYGAVAAPSAEPHHSSANRLHLSAPRMLRDVQQIEARQPETAADHRLL